MLKNRDSIEDGYALYHSVGHRPNGSQEMAAAVSDFSLMWTAPIPDVWPKALSMLEEFRQSFSMLLGPSASSEEIGLVDSVTSGFLRIIDGLGSDYLEGKSILIADDAFPSLHFLLQGMQKLLKFNIRRVAIRQGQYHVENSDYLKELKNEDVALALVTWVSSTTSAMMDLEAIAIEAPESCILVCDATQCIGVRKLNLPDRFDALISTSLKWLCGTAGAGVIWVRKSRIELFEPKFRGWFSQENPMNWDIDNFHLATNSKRFENGTPNPMPYVAGLPGLNWVVQGGNILQEKHNILIDFTEKPDYTNLVNTGVYLMKQNVISEIPNNSFFNATDLIRKYLSENKKIFIHKVDSYWKDIGKIEDLKIARKDIKQIF